MDPQGLAGGAAGDSAGSAETYGADDVQRILAIALDERSRSDTTFSSVALSDMAQELGLDGSDLAQAIKVWQSEKGLVAKEAAKVLQKQRQWQRFYRWELLPCLAVNTFLLLLNFSLSGAITWAIYPLLGWGLGLCLSAPLFALNPGGFCQKGCQKDYAGKAHLLDEAV